MPRILLVDGWPTRRGDPTKPLRSAAFGGWLMALATTADDIEALMHRTVEFTRRRLGRSCTSLEFSASSYRCRNTVHRGAPQAQFNSARTGRRPLAAPIGRRQLLKVIRSLQSSTRMSAFVGHHGARKGGAAPPKTLGAYLIALEQHSVVGLGALTAAQRAHFYLRIVKVRNTYMHEAGAVPSTDVDVQSLLSEMHACLTVVSRL